MRVVLCEQCLEPCEQRQGKDEMNTERIILSYNYFNDFIHSVITLIANGMSICRYLRYDLLQSLLLLHLLNYIIDIRLGLFFLYNDRSVFGVVRLKTRK